MTAIDPTLKNWLAAAMIAYVAVMYVLGAAAKRRIESVEDYVVAGRRLPLSLAWMTLLATWFGAGTMLTAADEVRAGGLQRAALDPFGAGACLLIAGFFVAGPMWRMQLLTVPDFFRRRFGSAAELIASLILVPSYFGWIAAQFTALAEVLELFFGIPLSGGLLIVAVVGTGYTLMGGMWSVTLTDAVQISLVLAGLIVLSVVVLVELGSGSVFGGMERLVTETDPHLLCPVPTADTRGLVGWLGVFAIGAFGNLPGQDLMQRVFAARSEATAKRACLVAGAMYLIFGALPLLLALSGRLLFPQDADLEILPALAHAFLHPAVAVVFVVALLSAVLSTIDSAILSPATVLAQNVFPRLSVPGMPEMHDALRSNRVAVSLVAASSLALAYCGSSAYELLEDAYLLTLVGLFVPLMLGLYSRSPRRRRDGAAAFGRSVRVSSGGNSATEVVLAAAGHSAAATTDAAVSNSPAGNAAMLVGVTVWAVHAVCGWETFVPPAPAVGTWEVPLSLAATGCSLLAYFVCEPPWRIAWGRPPRHSIAEGTALAVCENE